LKDVELCLVEPTPTLSELQELAGILIPHPVERRRAESLGQLPKEEFAEQVALHYLEDAVRRMDELSRHRAWRWIKSHPSYMVFLETALKKYRRRKHAHVDQEPTSADDYARVKAKYKHWAEHRVSIALESIYGTGNFLARWAEPIELRWALAVANALVASMYAISPRLLKKALQDARRHVRKAREAFFVLDVVEAGGSNLRNIDSMLKQLDGSLKGEIEEEKGRALNNVRSRRFLEVFICELGTQICGTKAGLRRLAEIADPESTISDDTIHRIIKAEEKREKEREASLESPGGYGVFMATL
jgi:hypothetical protein